MSGQVLCLVPAGPLSCWQLCQIDSRGAGLRLAPYGGPCGTTSASSSMRSLRSHRFCCVATAVGCSRAHLPADFVSCGAPFRIMSQSESWEQPQSFGWGKTITYPSYQNTLFDFASKALCWLGKIGAHLEPRQRG